MATSRQRRSGLALAAGLGAMALLGACGGEIRAERQGRQLGRSICDVKQADSADEAQRQLDQAQRQMNDIRRIVGRPIDEDVRDIQENLSDLVEHAANGNDTLLQQDIAVIQRNVAAIARTLTGKAKAAYEGLYDGLGDCGY